MYALSLIVLLFLQASFSAQAQPSLPFYDWGACPFEGCTYRRWEAVKSVTVWTGRDRRHVAFTIKPKEWTSGITGVVITTRPGISKVLVKMTLGNKAKVALAPGDLLYTLHDLGEASISSGFAARPTPIRYLVILIQTRLRPERRYKSFCGPSTCGG